MNKYLRSSRNYRYSAWLHMVARCTRPHHYAWKDYGGRGITVCDRWLCFESFVDDIGERPGPGYSIDRINNDDGYHPLNCRWVTWSEQARNRRPPKPRKSAIRVDGLTLTQLSKLHGIKRDTLKLRYRMGKRGNDLLARDLRDGSHWRGKKRNPDGKMVKLEVVPRD